MATANTEVVIQVIEDIQQVLAANKQLLVGADKTFDKIETEARKAGKGMDRSFEKASKEVRQEFDQIEKDARKAFKGIGKSLLTGLTAGFSSAVVSKAIGGFVATVRTSMRAATGFVMESVDAFTTLERQIVALNARAKQEGIEGINEYVNSLEAVKLGLIGFGEGAEIIKRLLASGLNIQEATQLANAFGNQVAFNDASSRSYTDSLLALAAAQKTGETEIFKSVGARIKEADIMKVAIEQTGKLEEAITEEDRARARAQIAMRQFAETQGDINRFAETSAGLNLRLATSFTNIKESVGEAVQTAIKPLLESLAGDEGVITKIDAWAAANKKIIESKIRDFLIEVGKILPFVARGFGVAGQAATLLGSWAAAAAQTIFDAFGKVLEFFGDWQQKVSLQFRLVAQFAPFEKIREQARRMNATINAVDLTGLGRKSQQFAESAGEAAASMMTMFRPIGETASAVAAGIENLTHEMEAARDATTEAAAAVMGGGGGTGGEGGAGGGGVPTMKGGIDVLSMVGDAWRGLKDGISKVPDIIGQIPPVTQDIAPAVDTATAAMDQLVESTARAAEQAVEATRSFGAMAGSVAGIGESMEGIQTAGSSLLGPLSKVFGTSNALTPGFRGAFGANVQSPATPAEFAAFKDEFGDLFQEFGESFPFASVPPQMWDDIARGLRDEQKREQERDQDRTDTTTGATSAGPPAGGGGGGTAEINITINTAQITSPGEQESAIRQGIAKAKPYLIEAGFVTRSR